MDSSNASTESITTNVFDLNFDCLWIVFEHLGLIDLCAVADVCKDFKKIARAVYGYSNWKDSLRVYNDFCWLQEYPSEILLRTAKLVRNFGALTKVMDINGVCYDLSLSEQESYQKRLINLLAKYCKGSLDELNVYRFSVTKEVAHLMRPMLRRLKKMKIQDYQWGDLNLDILMNSTKLVELEFQCSSMPKKQHFDEWHYSIPSMQSIAFETINVTNRNIDEILLLNPQLKKIEISSCRFVTDSVLKSLAQHVQQIETIHFRTENPTRGKNIKYLGRMQGLRSLQLSGFDGNTKCVVREIAAGCIPLEHLHLKLSWCDPHHNVEQLVQEIVKLKSLKTLRLEDCKYLNVNHIMDICNQLPDLAELHLKYWHYNEFKLDFSANDLLSLLEQAGNLKVVNFGGFQLKHQAHIDAKTFMQMVNIIEHRQEKTCVEVKMEVNTIIANIPKEIASAFTNFLKLKISE